EIQKYKGGSFFLEYPDPEAVFTPEDFSDEHKMIAETAREFVEKEVQPLAEAIEEHHFEHSVALMKKAGELGLLSSDIPEEYEGLGLDKVSATLITENIVRGGSWSLTHGAHTGIGTLPIVFFGTPEQKQKYLPALGSGEKIAAYALTEPGSGSDALGAKTTAVLSPDGKHYVLNGTKQWITNAGLADVFIVYAKVDGDKFTAFIVDRDAAGLSTGPEEKKMGIKGSSTRSVILEDCQVPVANVLGEIGRGHVIAFNILNIGRWKLAAGCVGASKEAIALSAKYAKERQQFGKPIASFRLIQEKLADMAIRIYVLESMVYRTAGLLDAGLHDIDPTAPDAGRQATKAIEEYAIECSINKVYGSEALDFVADEGLQIHGGYGYMYEYAIEHIYRDSRINRIFEGTNEINRLLVPGTLVRRTMKGELPLMQAIMALQNELMGMTPPELDEAPLAQEKHLLAMAKKAFLMVAGLGVQKYQQALNDEQELLANMADIGIEIFAMESALLRAEKAIAHSGVEAAQAKIDMATAYVHDAFERIGVWARESLAALDDGDTLRTNLSVLKKLLRVPQPVNVIGIKRTVAARVLEAEKFTA
ncbi:MAG: acyl-CoA dehydrogenase family protein, partial [Firmicutes bacterium]|nr:acyl-CoA dehydrogenase family protein [Bacillota bacterium]